MMLDTAKRYIIGMAAGVVIVTIQGCTPEEQAFATGAALGAVGAAIFYDHPHYYDRPYYYYHGHYYYGGYYRNGYYYHHGHRYHGGHYYHNGYRYYNGRRYRAVTGQYGYYPSGRAYEQYRKKGHYVGRSGNARSASGYRSDHTKTEKRKYAASRSTYATRSRPTYRTNRVTHRTASRSSYRTTTSSRSVRTTSRHRYR